MNITEQNKLLHHFSLNRFLFNSRQLGRLARRVGQEAYLTVVDGRQRAGVGGELIGRRPERARRSWQAARIRL